MKLESLKSEKFEALSDSKMNTIKGGNYSEKTGGGYLGITNDRTIYYSEDCNEFDSKGLRLGTECLVEGRWMNIDDIR